MKCKNLRNQSKNRIVKEISNPDKPPRKNNLARINLPKYISKVNPDIYPYLKNTVIEMDCKYYNTHALDDKIVESFPEWGKTPRILRLSIIGAVLAEEFKFLPWANHSKKIVYDPSKPEYFTGD